MNAWNFMFDALNEDNRLLKHLCFTLLSIKRNNLKSRFSFYPIILKEKKNNKEKGELRLLYTNVIDSLENSLFLLFVVKNGLCKKYGVRN